ncbi:MAG TPA: hypothetical protein VN799_08560, partial [Acidimicrobiales bacterium]|nr:hypothetical protein [Acidimicrobiales bacterium]
MEHAGLPVPGVRGQRLAMAASRVRSRMIFMVLDALVLAVCYSLAELVYFRDRPPAHYAGRFGAFLLVALVIQLTANHVFGLYGRMWRHAGIEEARQILLSSGASLIVLVAL